MNPRTGSLAAGLCLAVAGWSGCRSGPPPERLYREAEVLRLKYEKSASEQAVAQYQAAAAAWARSKDFRQAARAGQRAGATYAQLGLLHESLKAYRAALTAAQASGDPALAGEILSDAGTARSLVAIRESDFDEAQRQCEASLETSKRTGGGLAEARAYMCLGEAAYNRGERERAAGHYDQARIISVRLGDRRGEAEALVSLGAVYSDQSEFELAEQCFIRSRQAWADLGDARGSAITLVGIAKLQERLGEYQSSLNGLNSALEVLQRMGDMVWEAACLSAIGSIYMRAGEPTNAIDYWERALDRFQTAGLSTFSVDQLRSLGEAYLAAGDDGRALDRFERALALGVELGDDHWQAYALENIGLAHLHRGEATQAVDFFERSLDVQTRIRDPRTEAETRTSLAEAWRILGDYARARREFEVAVELSRKADDRFREAEGLDGLARVFVNLNDLRAARRNVERALELAESLRAELGSRELRASYFASVYRYHERHMEVLMRLDRAEPGRGLDAAAFMASEQARARALLDALAEAGVDLRKDVAPQLRQREQALRNEYEAWAARQRQALDGRADPALARRLAGEYKGLEARYNALEGEIRSTSPRYAALAKPQPLTLPQVQKEVLDGESILLEYALGEDRSYLWAVTKTAYSVHELPPRAEIVKAVQELYERLTARLTLTGTLGDRRRLAEEADAFYWKQAAELSRVLLGPVAKEMAGKRILVVADGALQYVPFGALPGPGSVGDPVPLLAEHEVVSLPSASALAVLREQTSGRAPAAKAVAVLADPVFERDDPRLRAALRAAGTPMAQSADAPVSSRPGAFRPSRLAATRLEADAILAAAGKSPSVEKLDFEASLPTAMSPDLAQYRVVHFATHGLFDNDNPGMSGIMLSLFDNRGRARNGFLRLHDIYGLKLPVDLVVLSACNTALGKPMSGEGVVGIVRGFMYAGARRVVASLWKVDDEATGELMRRFYEGMFRDHLAPAAALRQAQLGIWRQSRWSAPFYWAAFSLQGEWKP